MFLDEQENPICDMNCFYPRGHDGPHQKWLGADCDVSECSNKAAWRVGKKVVCDEHSNSHNQPAIVRAAIALKELREAMEDVRSITPTGTSNAAWNCKHVLDMIDHGIDLIRVYLDVP